MSYAGTLTQLRTCSDMQPQPAQQTTQAQVRLACSSCAARGCSVPSGGRHVHGRAGVGRCRVYSSLALRGRGRGHRALARRGGIRLRGGRRGRWRGRRRRHREDEALGRLDSQAGRLVGEDRRQAATCGTHTARSTRGTPEAGTRMAHVQRCAPPRQAALCLRCARYSRPSRVPGTYGTAAARRTCQRTPPPLPLPRPPRPLPMPLPSRATSSSTITWGGVGVRCAHAVDEAC